VNERFAEALSGRNGGEENRRPGAGLHSHSAEVIKEPQAGCAGGDYSGTSVANRAFGICPWHANARWNARGRPDRIPRERIATTFWRPSTTRSNRASIGALRRQPPRLGGSPISVAFNGKDAFHGVPAELSYLPEPTCSPTRGEQRTWGSMIACDYTKGIPSDFGESSSYSRSTPAIGESSPSFRSARPAVRASSDIRLREARWKPSPPDQSALPVGELEAIVLIQAAPQPPGDRTYYRAAHFCMVIRLHMA